MGRLRACNIYRALSPRGSVGLAQPLHRSGNIERDCHSAVYCCGFLNWGGLLASGSWIVRWNAAVSVIQVAGVAMIERLKQLD